MANKTKIFDNGSFNVGLVLVIVGSALLLQKMGYVFSGWMFTWPMIFLVIGTIALIRHKFQSGFGYFMILFGTFFLLRNEGLLPPEYRQYLVPAGLIALGAYFIFFKSTRSSWASTNWSGKTVSEVNEDEISIDTVFSGIERKVISKNFQGGKIAVNFGGGVVDLTQCELGGHAELKLDVTFGGLELVIPAHWVVKMEITNTFAGIEDKRSFPIGGQDNSKTLLIKGNVNFGGLEIKSY
jgi:hypothetical protein